MKALPNILITGTPGTGKSTLAQMIQDSTDLQWVNVGDIAKDNNCFEGHDEELNCPIIDEEKVLDELEPLIEEGGKIVDYHGCEWFPERFFDIVFVLRSDNTILYDRLASRGYSGKKLSDNLDCEIHAVLRDEALDSYDENIVHELNSNSYEDLESNCTRIISWIENWSNQND